MYKTLKKTIFTMPLLFHIAISDQNRELDAILHMFLDLQSAQRQRTERGNVSDHIQPKLLKPEVKITVTV